MFKREIKDILEFSHWINTMTSKGLECRADTIIDVF